MKNGFTMMSIVIYVLLFFTFTVFATAISSNLSHRVLSEKADIKLNEGYMKAYFNLFDSAKKSNKIDIVAEKIIFSNGDIYTYNNSDKIVYKNGGILVQDVELFLVENVSSVLGDFNNISDINTSKILNVKIILNKYNVSNTKNIAVTLGDGLYE